jgi:hypothetical protein
VRFHDPIKGCAVPNEKRPPKNNKDKLQRTFWNPGKM